jgi:hypothetical protein
MGDIKVLFYLQAVVEEQASMAKAHQVLVLQELNSLAVALV